MSAPTPPAPAISEERVPTFALRSMAEQHSNSDVRSIAAELLLLRQSCAPKVESGDDPCYCVDDLGTHDRSAHEPAEAQRYALDKERCGMVPDATGNWVQVTDYWTAFDRSRLTKAEPSAGVEMRELLLESLDQIDCRTGDTDLDNERRGLKARISGLLALTAGTGKETQR